MTWHTSETGIGTRKFSDPEVLSDFPELPSPLSPAGSALPQPIPLFSSTYTYLTSRFNSIPSHQIINSLSAETVNGIMD